MSIKTYQDRVGVERCVTCTRAVEDAVPTAELFAAAIRALRYFENQAAGAYNGPSEDLMCGRDLKLALAACVKEPAESR